MKSKLEVQLPRHGTVDVQWSVIVWLVLVVLALCAAAVVIQMADGHPAQDSDVTPWLMSQPLPA